MKFSKSVIALVLCFFAVSGLYAREVNRSELESTGSADVIQFENYTGPHSKIDSAASIKGIGSSIGSEVAGSLDKTGTYGSGKYYVIHAIDESQKDKFDADIFIVTKDATVDHIRNLRWIIASYLTKAYGYSEKDASTIATFITVYNAVYRGKLDVFQKKYKDVVTKNLSKDKCGISTKYSEWPGATQIVIPLNDINGGLSTIETSVISDKQVVESMQEEDDKGIDERKNMVDIKEREAEDANEKAQAAQKKATEEKAKAKEEQKKADEAKAEAAKDPDNKEKQQEAEDAQKKADEAKQKADESSEEAKEKQEFADRKQTEAQSERKEIAQDQQKVVEQQMAEESAEDAVIGLKVTDSSSNMSGMVKVDSKTGKTLRESPVTVIRGRTILSASEDETNEAGTDNMFIAICGENKGNGAIKLCVLDGYKMEIQKESNEVIAENSVLVRSGEDILCVINQNGKFYLAKYNSDLKLIFTSQETVFESTPITVTSKGVVVTSESGQVLLLNKDDFSLIK